MGFLLSDISALIRPTGSLNRVLAYSQGTIMASAQRSDPLGVLGHAHSTNAIAPTSDPLRVLAYSLGAIVDTVHGGRPQHALKALVLSGTAEKRFTLKVELIFHHVQGTLG